LNKLVIWQNFNLANHFAKLAIAVVDELNEGVVGGLARSAMVQEHFYEVHGGYFMVYLAMQDKNGLSSWKHTGQIDWRNIVFRSWIDILSKFLIYNLGRIDRLIYDFWNFLRLS